MPPTLPPYDPKRQADHVARAFRYQFIETAIAWLELAPSETLCVEVVEDFDRLSGDGSAEIVQITHTSINQTLTLASKKSRDAIKNFWIASSAGTNPKIKMIIHTNMTAGKEARVTFPGDTNGIEYWACVQEGADAKPLTNALKKLLDYDSILDWLNAEPNLNDIVTRLVSKISWKVGQGGGAERTAFLTKLLAGRLASLGFPTGYATNATRLLVSEIHETASNSAPEHRCLTASNLNSFLQEAVRPGQQGHELRWELASWTIPLDLDSLPGDLANRELLVRSLSTQLTDMKALWLHGASGTGKSTLARQVAAQTNGSWLLVDFRDQADPIEILRRLDRIYTDVTLTEEITGIVLDDLDPDFIARNSLRCAPLFEWLQRKTIKVIVTASRSLSRAISQQMRFEQNSIIAAPYLTEEDVEGMTLAAQAPKDMSKPWGLLIHAATQLGHPQLTAAKIASLAHRGWPAEALTEDLIGNASEALELTRAEARRRLLREATGDGRMLLKRLASIAIGFDRSIAISAASVEPVIDEPSAILDLLTGPWIEHFPGSKSFFRLSPLLTRLNEDLNVDIAAAVQAGTVLNIVKRRPFPFEALDIAVWNAILSKQSWFFTGLLENVFGLDDPQEAALATRLNAIVFLDTNKSVFPDDLRGSLSLRLIQLKVATINRYERLFQSIAEAALHEASLLGDPAAERAMRAMIIYEILSSRGVQLDWAMRLKLLEEMHEFSRDDPIIKGALENIGEDELSKISPEADAIGFFLAVGLEVIQSPVELENLFDALGNLPEKPRIRWLRQFKAFSQGYGLYIQAAWANAFFAGNLDAKQAVQIFEKIEKQAQIWSDDALAQQCVVAQSVLWDEQLNERSTAHAVIDRALENDQGSSALLRQKAKLLGHDHDYEGARAIFARLKSRRSELSTIEQCFALQEEAIAAAKLARLSEARSLFLKAVDLINPSAGDDSDMRYYKIAFLAEAALCSWRNGDRSEALKEFSSVLDATLNVDPQASNVAVMLFANVGWLINWLNQLTSLPRGEAPKKLEPGAISTLNSEPGDEHKVDQGKVENWKVILTTSALREGVVDLPIQIDWLATHPAVHLGLVVAEFDLAIESRNPDVVSEAVLNIAVGLKTVAMYKAEEGFKPNLPIRNGKGIELKDLGSDGINQALNQLVVLAIFLLREVVPDRKVFLRGLISSIEGRLGAPKASLLTDHSAALEGRSNESGVAQLVSYLISNTCEPMQPAQLLNYHLLLIDNLQIAGIRTVRAVIAAIADDWKLVVEKQSFRLYQPSQTVPTVLAAIEKARANKSGALAELLQAASSSLNSELPADWDKLCERVGGVAPLSIT